MFHICLFLSKVVLRTSYQRPKCQKTTSLLQVHKVGLCWEFRVPCKNLSRNAFSYVSCRLRRLQSCKGQNLKVSSTVISAMFKVTILEIETFFSHDSTALVCLIIVDILLFSIMIMMWPMNCCFTGKKYCYGSMQGEYCHCDYCKCKHGYGAKGYGHCH